MKRSPGAKAVCRAALPILFALVLSGGVARADYEDEVLEDEPVAYWRLGEDDPFVPAENLGSGLDALNGTYTGEVLVEEDGLISDDPDTAVAFNGIDAQVNIPDSPLTNNGGPWEMKTIELWFQAEVIDTEPRILFEEGGTTNGFSVYVHEVDGDQLLFMAAWAGGQGWRPSVAVGVEIEEGVTYHAVMVFDASENEEFGDFDGRVTGYLDGEEFETQIGADLMNNHTDDTAIGAASAQTKLADDTEIRGGGQFFQGTIDEVAIYDSLLDDPDDDGDFADSRVLDHYMAGVGDAGARPVFHRGDTDGDGTLAITDAVSMLGFLFGGGGDTMCKETQDYDNDGNVVITDAVGILGFLFSGGAPPASPGPTSEPCGPDPDEEGSPGDLGCEAYESC